MWMLLLVLIGLVVKEWYPFSRFAMYSQPRRTTWYVYVTDGADRPVNLRRQFGTSVVRMRKFYSGLGSGRYATDDADRGRAVLAHLRARRLAKRKVLEEYPVLRLWHVKVAVDDAGRLVRTPRLLAEDVR